MNNRTENNSEAWQLAHQTAHRYGRLALTRAAGEAATAQRQGDGAKTALWASVIATLRTEMLRTATA